MMPSSGLDRAGIVILPLGLIMLGLGYQSPAPVLVSLILGLVVYAVLAAMPGVGRLARTAFLLSFATGTFWAGLAAIYTNQFPLSMRSVSDAAYFNSMVLQYLDGSLAEFPSTEHIGPILLWAGAYRLFGLLGMGEGPYIGIALNATVIALAAAIAVIGARAIYDDRERLTALIRLFAFMPLHWLFAAVFLRDAFLVLVMTAFMAVFLHAMARRDLVSVAALLLASVLFYFVAGLFRHELPIMAVAMFLAAGIAMLWSLRSSSPGSYRIVGSVFLVVVLIASPTTIQQFFAIQHETSDAYALLAQTQQMECLDCGALAMMEMQQPAGEPASPSSRQAERVHASHTSLGMALIVNQPSYVRFFAGSAYLWLFPIPFWAGLDTGQVYQLFKSLNALYMYLLIPAFGIAGWRALRGENDQSGAMLFCLLCALGFTGLIAITSLETRHLGMFMPFALVLAASVPWTEAGNGRLLRRATAATLVGVAGLHLAWFLAKTVLPVASLLPP